MPAEKPHFTPPCRQRLRALTLLGCFLPLLAATGCGTGEYERRLSERDSKIQAQKAAKFSVIGNPQDLADTGVSIGIPRAFTNPPLVDGQADARRVKPEILTIPGLQLTHEGFVQDAEEGQIPYYLYVGVTAGPLQNIANTMQNELNGKQGGKVVAPWADFKGEAANGPGNNWRKLRFEIPQDFYYKDKTGKEEFRPMPGMLEVYLFDAGKQVVIVAWSMPTSIEASAGLANLAPLVAGSVNVRQ